MQNPSNTLKTLSALGLIMIGLVFGLILGKVSEKGGVSGRSPLQQNSGRTKSSNARDLPLDTASSRLKAIRNAPPSKLPGLTYRALETGDLIERQIYIGECLRNMTRDNWQEVISSFDNISNTTGRDPNAEWKLALFRSGQVAGEEAMNQCAAQGLDRIGDRPWVTLYGWASTDPRRALAWLQELEKNGAAPSKSLYNALMAGASLGNPQAAFALLKQLPPGQTDDCAGHLVWNLTQNGGTQQLDALLDHVTTLDPGVPAEATLRRKIQSEVSGRLFWQVGHSGNVEDATSAIAKLVHSGLDADSVTARALSAFHGQSMDKQLDVIDATANNLPSTADLNLSKLISRLNSADGAADVEQWKRNHPRSKLIPFLSQTE